jgi:hypothetical protein
VPFDIIGQHAQEDVGADAVGEAVMDGTDAQVDRFQGSKGALDIPWKMPLIT